MLSVIIPIYNTGHLLKSCVDSICHQTYKDLEIILVDDGSEVVTAQICDDLSQSDTRIKVIHKENEGVSIARNHGLDLAKGEFIGFVDSDDIIEPNMYEMMISELLKHDAEIAICDAVTVCPGKPDILDTIEDYLESTIIDVKNLSSATLTRLAGAVWRCIYRRKDILLTDQLRFPKGIKFSEDRIFNIIAIGLADRMVYIKKPLYRRLIRRGSACFRYYPDMTEQIVKMRAELLRNVTQYWGEEYIGDYERQIAGQIHYAVTNYTSIENNLTIRDQIRNLKGLCRHTEIRECVTNAGNKDIRSRCLISERYVMLYLLGKVTNMLHRIFRKGQYSN